VASETCSVDHQGNFFNFKIIDQRKTFHKSLKDLGVAQLVILLTGKFVKFTSANRLGFVNLYLAEQQIRLFFNLTSQVFVNFETLQKNRLKTLRQ